MRDDLPLSLVGKGCFRALQASSAPATSAVLLGSAGCFQKTLIPPLQVNHTQPGKEQRMKYYGNAGLRESGIWREGESAHYMRNAWYFASPDPEGHLARLGNQQVTIAGLVTGNKAHAAFEGGMSLRDRHEKSLLLSYRVRFGDGTEVTVLESELRESKDFLLAPIQDE
jgi:hypothetical protein